MNKQCKTLAWSNKRQLVEHIAITVATPEWLEPVYDEIYSNLEEE